MCFTVPPRTEKREVALGLLFWGGDWVELRSDKTSATATVTDTWPPVRQNLLLGKTCYWAQNESWWIRYLLLILLRFVCCSSSEGSRGFSIFLLFFDFDTIKAEVVIFKPAPGDHYSKKRLMTHENKTHSMERTWAGSSEFFCLGKSLLSNFQFVGMSVCVDGASGKLRLWFSNSRLKTGSGPTSPSSLLTEMMPASALDTLPSGLLLIYAGRWEARRTKDHTCTSPAQWV